MLYDSPAGAGSSLGGDIAALAGNVITADAGERQSCAAFTPAPATTVEVNRFDEMARRACAMSRQQSRRRAVTGHSECGDYCWWPDTPSVRMRRSIHRHALMTENKRNGETDKAGVNRLSIRRGTSGRKYSIRARRNFALKTRSRVVVMGRAGWPENLSRRAKAWQYALSAIYYRRSI